jgi:hypothetical protein
LFIFTSSFLAAEAPKPDVAVSSNQSAGATKTKKETTTIISTFKPTVDSEENKEARSSKDCHRRCQQRNEVVMKKRELAERQAAAAATTADEKTQHEASDGVPVVPDAASVVPEVALSTSAADADLNSRIEEIFEEFQEMGTKIDVNES